MLSYIDNIVTPQVQTNGYGGVDIGRFEQAIEQIDLPYKLKKKPGVADLFNSSYFSPVGKRRAA